MVYSGMSQSVSELEEGWRGIHSHCLSCVSTNISCSSLAQRGCPVVLCPNCLVPLHSCKLDDHTDTICPDQLVPCCNQGYGCTASMKRRTVGAHLEHCPASVLQCRYAYVRLQHKSFKSNVSTCSSSEPSMLHKMLLNDLEFIKSSGCIDPRIEKKCRIPYDEGAVCVECVRMHSYHNQIILCGTNDGKFPQGRRTYLHSTYRHYDNTYTNPYKTLPCHMFACGLFVRRKDFSNHMKQHDDLGSELPFKIRHCPNHQYGCDFHSVEVVPKPLETTLEYNPALNLFFTNIRLEIPIGACDNDMFTVLPIELLMYLFAYLDCCSMWSLSQTCSYLRKLCEECLAEKGIVYCFWEKENDKWINSKLVS